MRSVRVYPLTGIMLIAGALLMGAPAMADENMTALQEKSESETADKEKTKDSKKGRPIVARDKGGASIVLDSRSVPANIVIYELQEQKKALLTIERALEDIRHKEKKAETEREKLALESAREGLEAAREAVQERAEHIVELRTHHAELRADFSDDLRGAIDDVVENQAELDEMRLDLSSELSEARREIAEAIGDVEMDIDLDGEVREIRLRSLRQSERSISEMERQHLRALRQAEAELRRTRQLLEKKLQQLEDREAAAEKSVQGDKSPNSR